MEFSQEVQTAAMKLHSEAEHDTDDAIEAAAKISDDVDADADKLFWAQVYECLLFWQEEYKRTGGSFGPRGTQL